MCAQLKTLAKKAKLPYQSCYEKELKPHVTIIRNSVICTSGGVKMASALGSTGMRGSVTEKTLDNMGFAWKK